MLMVQIFSRLSCPHDASWNCTALSSKTQQRQKVLHLNDDTLLLARKSCSRCTWYRTILSYKKKNYIYVCRSFVMHYKWTALNHREQTVTLTAEDVGGKGAAGDPEVVGVILFVELLHVQVPQSQVPVSGSSRKHLTAGAEGAGYHGCVAHCCSPSEKNSRSCINCNSDVWRLGQQTKMNSIALSATHFWFSVNFLFIYRF